MGVPEYWVLVYKVTESPVKYAVSQDCAQTDN